MKDVYKKSEKLILLSFIKRSIEIVYLKKSVRKIISISVRMSHPVMLLLS